MNFLSALNVFDIPTVLFLLLVLFVLFFIFRELVTWYWKLSEIVKLLEKIEYNTRKEGVKHLEDKPKEVPSKKLEGSADPF